MTHGSDLLPGAIDTLDSAYPFVSVKGVKKNIRQPGSQALPLKVIRTDRLDEFREQYQLLLDSLGRADTVYFDLDLMAAMDSCFLADDSSGRNKESYFLLAFRGARLIGVMPLVREKKRLTRFGIKRIYHYGETNNSLMVSFPQCLAFPNEKSECLSAFVDYLQTNSQDWDVVELGYLFLPEEIALYQGLVPGCRVEQDLMKCHAANLSDGFEAFMNGFSSKHRRNLRRSKEKLESSHRNVRFLETEQLTPQQWQEVEQLHINRQQVLRQHGVERDSLFEHVAQKRAFIDGDTVLTRKQKSRHYLLYADDRLIAFQLCYRNRDVTYFQLIGMDDEYCQYSPAKLLLLYAYEYEAREGVQEVNLLLGTNPLKAKFGQVETTHYRVSWSNPAWSSSLRISLWRASQWLKAKLVAR